MNTSSRQSAREGAGAARGAANREELEAPRTQIVHDRDDYLGQGRNDVGRRISADQVELFISSDVAGALQQEFVRHAPEFIALHDLGISASLRIISGLASSAGATVQRLSIRRQGHGVALAVLQFVEVPLADGTPVRVYATDLNADTPTRTQVARVLLAHSRLGVLLVGALPPHALTSQLQPLREALLRGPWPNRDVLMVPLGAGTALASQATHFGAQTSVQVHVTPQASKPRQAWTFIGGAWNRLHGQPGGERALQTDMALAVPKPRVPQSEAATEPMPLDAPLGRQEHRTPSPQPGAFIEPLAPVPMPKPGATPWQQYADRVGLIKGTVSCCLFDLHTQQKLAHTGGHPSGERMAQQGTALLAQMQEAARALGLGGVPAEASISTSGHHVLMRAVPGHPGVAVMLVLLSSSGNLTLARMQLERIEVPQ